MDKSLLEKFLRLMESPNDPDAVMGLRGLQNLFQSEKASLNEALRYAADHMEQWLAKPAVDKPVEKVAVASAAVNMSGVPDCRVSRSGVLEIVREGNSTGDAYPLPGESARHADAISQCLMDAIVAAVINKSRFKLKLNDVKNSKGDIETVLQAEYERPGMSPVPVWTNTRGEVGALATVLRKLVATSLPELAAV
jgi:hypothetical protein